MPFELGHSAAGAGQEAGAESAEPAQAPPGAEPPEEAGEGEADEASPEPGPFDKAPPRGLLIGVAAGLALLLVIGGGLVAYRKLARRPPPPAAVEALATAQSDADKDTLASIASAESKARDAVEVAGPRARFPEATAALARVEIQWADAFNEQAAQLADRSADDTRAAQRRRDGAEGEQGFAGSAARVRGLLPRAAAAFEHEPLSGQREGRSPRRPDPGHGGRARGEIGRAHV